MNNSNVTTNEKTNQIIDDYLNTHQMNFDCGYGFYDMNGNIFKDEYWLNIERKRKERRDNIIEHIIKNFVEIDLTDIQCIQINIKRSETYTTDFRWNDVYGAFEIIKNPTSLHMNIKLATIDLDIMNIFYKRLNEAVNLKKIVFEGVYGKKELTEDAEYITEEQFIVLSEYISSNPVNLKTFELKFLYPKSGYMNFLNSLRYNTFLEDIMIPVPHHLSKDNNLEDFFKKRGLKNITLYFSIFGLSVKERHLVNELIDNINNNLDVDVNLVIYKDNFNKIRFEGGNLIEENRFSTSKYNFDPNNSITSINNGEYNEDNDEDDENLDYEDDENLDHEYDSSFGYNKKLLRRTKTRYNIHTKYFEEMNDRLQKSGKKNNISECLNNSLLEHFNNLNNSNDSSDTRCKLVCDVFNSHELFNIMSKSLKIYNNSVEFKSSGMYFDSF